MSPGSLVCLTTFATSIATAQIKMDLSFSTIQLSTHLDSPPKAYRDFLTYKDPPTPLSPTNYSQLTLHSLTQTHL